MKSKKKNIALPIILSLLAAAVVAVVVLAKRKFRRYELTDEGKNFLQVYKSDGTALYYATGAESVKVNPNDEKKFTYEEGIVVTNGVFIPIKAVYWDEGAPKRFAADAYILKDKIKL